MNKRRDFSLLIPAVLLGASVAAMVAGRVDVASVMWLLLAWFMYHAGGQRT